MTVKEPQDTKNHEHRGALEGLADKLFKVVSKGATFAQWEAWLHAPLEHALASGNLDLMMSLLKAGARAREGLQGCNGRTLPDVATESGKEEFVHAVLDAGSQRDLNTVSGQGGDAMSALHRAITGGHTAVARILLLAGADVGFRDSCARTALHAALVGGHVQLIEYIVIAGADLNAADITGYTPMHYAADLGDPKLVSTLARRGAELKVVNMAGQHPLHIALEKHKFQAAETLLKAGANPNFRCGKYHRESPMYLARSNLTMTKALIRYGADVKSCDDIGITVLHYTTVPGVIDALVEAGADKEAKTGNVRITLGVDEVVVCKGLTPLNFATHYRELKGMTALLRNGANVKATDDSGTGALHVVCNTCSIQTHASEALDLLLRWGADETATDNDGRTARDVIPSGGDPTGRLNKLLTNAPADRAWRRRGMLVMCRAFPDKKQRRDGRGSECETETAVGNKDKSLLARLVGLETDALFNAVVTFL